MKHAGGYSFPILSYEEIVPCLHEMRIPIDISQLSKPTYDIVKPLFECVAINLTGVTREELNQPVFLALGELQNPELHQDSIPALHLFRRLQKLMTSLGVADFALRDVFKPEPDRLRHQLSAIINLGKYRETKLLIYKEIQGQTDIMKSALAALQDQNLELEMECKQLLAQRASEQPEVNRVRAEKLQVTAKNQEYLRKIAALQQEQEALKTQFTKLKDAAGTKKLELMELQQENDQLQGQIVESPERLQKELEDQDERAAAERQTYADAERRLGDEKNRMALVTKVEKELQKCMALLREVKDERAAKKAASRACKEKQAQMEKRKQTIQSKSQSLARLNYELESWREKLRQAATRGTLQKTNAQAKLQHLKKQLEAQVNLNAAAASKAVETEAKVRKLQNEMQQEEAAHQENMRALGTAEQALLKNFQKWYEEIRLELEQFKQIEEVEEPPVFAQLSEQEATV